MQIDKHGIYMKKEDEKPDTGSHFLHFRKNRKYPGFSEICPNRVLLPPGSFLPRQIQ